jgi:hypothetical protein
MDKVWPLATGPTDQAIAPLAMMLIGLAGQYLLSKLNKPAATTSTQSGTSTTTPTLSPEAMKQLQDMLNQSKIRMNRGSYLPEGFSTNAVEGINNSFSGAKTSLNADLTARGLGTSPAATSSLQGLEQARGAQIGDLLSTKIPMLERQFQQEDQNNMLNLLNMFKGSTTTTTGSGTGTSTPASNPSDGLGTLLGQMYMQQQLNKNNASTNAQNLLTPPAQPQNDPFAPPTTYKHN